MKPQIGKDKKNDHTQHWQKWEEKICICSTASRCINKYNLSQESVGNMN